MTEVIKIRINIAGYGGAAASLFAAYDPDTELLLIARDAEYEDIDREGFLCVTNQPRDKHFDAVFSEDDTAEAIQSFFELDALKMVTLGERAKRHNPGNKIERDGMDEGGMKYRISPDIGCGQVAVLVACLCANKQRNIKISEDLMQEIMVLTV